MKRKQYLFLAVLLPCVVFSQLSRNSRWTKGLKEKYDVTLNISYTSVDTINARLDLYVPRNAEASVPVLVWYHGGGWGRLSKDSVSSQLIPFLEMGWVVVNVDYRLTPVALAPAAVEDCRSALNWIFQNASRIKADKDRIVLSGTSAGGHLALITGMLPAGTILDKNGANPKMRAAAIINFYGITDVPDINAQSKNRRGYAVSWLGDRPEADSIARLVSPLSYIRNDLPPIMTIHGDQDPTVPYEHAVRLHRALDSVGVSNEFMTIPGGVHGKFTKEQNVAIVERVKRFLLQHGVMRSK